MADASQTFAFDSAENQRLGGARSVDGPRPHVPAGYSAEAVAAGLTDPCAVAFDPRGLLYVVERGHPRRTPARLVRIDIATGIASVDAAVPEALRSQATTLALIDGAPTVAGAGGVWRLEGAEWIAVTESAPSAGDSADRGSVPLLLFPRSTHAAGDLYICDSGTLASPATGSRYAPATGIVWRVSASPEPKNAAVAFQWREGYGRLGELATRAFSPGVALGAGATFVIALSLAVYCRRSRARR